MEQGSGGLSTQVREPRYRRVPVPFHQAGWSGLGEGEQQKRCERRHGHVLLVTEKGIKCRECGAEWHDYKF